METKTNKMPFVGKPDPATFTQPRYSVKYHWSFANGLIGSRHYSVYCGAPNCRFYRHGLTDGESERVMDEHTGIPLGRALSAMSYFDRFWLRRKPAGW